MIIRLEMPADIPEIYSLTKRAFAPMAFSDGTEQDCINALRSDGDLTLSLVAQDNTGIVGHAAFSPAFIDGVAGSWFGLGPVAVHPDRQRSGIGSLLITDGLQKLTTLGADGCLLIGNPAYYSRLGFGSDGNLTYRGLTTKLVQWISLGSAKPTGEITFSPGLE